MFSSSCLDAFLSTAGETRDILVPVKRWKSGGGSAQYKTKREAPAAYQNVAACFATHFDGIYFCYVFAP